MSIGVCLWAILPGIELCPVMWKQPRGSALTLRWGRAGLLYNPVDWTWSRLGWAPQAVLHLAAPPPMVEKQQSELDLIWEVGAGQDGGEGCPSCHFRIEILPLVSTEPTDTLGKYPRTHWGLPVFRRDWNAQSRENNQPRPQWEYPKIHFQR